MKLLLFTLFVFFVSTINAQVVATQVTLTGTGTDVDGTIVSVKWRQVSGPASGVIVSPTSYTTVIQGYSIAGIYKYEFAVTDNQGAVGVDTVQVTVLSPNQKPKANAGSGIVIQLPQITYSGFKVGYLTAMKES